MSQSTATSENTTSSSTSNVFDLDDKTRALITGLLEAKLTLQTVMLEHTRLTLIAVHTNTREDVGRATDYYEQEVVPAKLAVRETRAKIAPVLLTGKLQVSVKLPRLNLELAKLLSFIEPRFNANSGSKVDGTNDSDALAAAEARFDEIIDMLVDRKDRTLDAVDEGLEAIFDVFDTGKAKLTDALRSGRTKLASKLAPADSK